MVAAAVCACALLHCSVGPAQPTTPTSVDAPPREPLWIAGEVVEIDNVPIEEYRDSNVQLVVATEGDKKVRVRLAPGWFLTERGLQFQREQRVEFHGDPDPVEQDVVIARGVRSGTTTLQLRDPTGLETWRGTVIAPVLSGDAPHADGGNDP